MEIENTLLNAFQESITAPKYANDFRLWLYDLFVVIKENTDVVKILQKANLLNVLFTKGPFWVENYTGQHSKEFHYHIIGNLGAIKSIALEWLNTGMQESPETMIDICMQYYTEQI